MQSRTFVIVMDDANTFKSLIFLQVFYFAQCVCGKSGVGILWCVADSSQRLYMQSNILLSNLHVCNVRCGGMVCIAKDILYVICMTN